VSGMVDDQLCARCDLGPCPSGSTCDPKTKRCLVGKTCVQSLGLEGRVPLTMIPGAEGKLDFITWLGGLVQMPAGGVTLGMIGGSAPNQVSTCIKPRPDLKPKTSPPVPVATLLRGDVDAKGQPYDLGIAVHQRLFDQGAWSAYTAGGLCIDVDSSLSDMLSTGTFSLIMPSINILTGGETSPMRLTLVPSAPPTLTIGKGIVEKDAKAKYTIKEPVLTIALKDLDIHMFAMVAERFVQVLNLKADVNIPIALQIANGEVVPVIGNLENALTNLRISGSELLAETPKSLETKFPIVLKLALGMLPDLVNQTFPLPAMMGLEIKDPTFVGIENNTMVGIFAQIALAPQKTSAEVPLPFPEAPAQTDAKVIEVLMPRDPEVMRLRRHDDLHHGPIARVAVGGPNDGRDLEYSWRLDHTTWSRFSRGSILEIQSSLLFLLGRHDLEIRARVAGLPNTTDPTPRRLTVTIKSPFDSPPSPASATDAPDDALGGCAIGRRSKGSSGLTGIFFSLLGLFALQRRRRRRQQQQRRHDGTRFIAALVVTTMVFATAACGGDTPATGDFGVSDASDLSPGENAIPTLKPGMVGRHSALAASTDTLYASAYEQTYGDLVFITAPVANLTQLTYEVVDGAPKAPVIHDPKGYRGGVERDGDDVGLGTDLTLDTAGAPIISYHDLTHHTLRFAQRSAEGWTSHEVAAPTAESQEIVGRYTAVTIVGGKPAIAFFVQNISKSAGTFGSELRWALAQTTSPKSATDWTISVIDAGFSPCQDLCAKDEGCFVTTTGSACKKVATGCATCAAKTACLAGKCEPVLEPSKLTDIPKALGIWPTLVATTSGTVFAVYHDALAGTLKVARLASASATTWTKKVVASSKSGEIVGAYPDATATATELQIAYQNATRGTLHHLDLELTTLASKGTSTIDDGLRPDGRHRVGADPAILVDSVGTARVAYQDQQTSDLLVVTRSAPGAWTPKKAGDANLGRLLKGGDKGYGFYTGLVLVGASVYGSSFVLEANGKPPGILEFFKLP
ncbi:MAG: hypothetical protein KAI47_06615, partial [Deltaproteobacteria bacterium]|nr:hypothetical protein [Deltaproteobacteria bacterium]